MLRTIDAATPHDNLVLLITFSCGETVLVDLADLPGTGGVLANLADPGFFALVAVGEGGRFLEWPLEIELCADALWHRAHPEEPALRPEVETSRAA